MMSDIEEILFCLYHVEVLLMKESMAQPKTFLQLTICVYSALCNMEESEIFSCSAHDNDDGSNNIADVLSSQNASMKPQKESIFYK